MAAVDVPFLMQLMQQLSAPELAAWLGDASRPAPLLLDVREPHEHAICVIPGSTLVPMRNVPASAAQWEAEREIVCICHHGGRSMQIAQFLAQRGYTAVYNLAGGVDAWARQVDTSMATY